MQLGRVRATLWIKSQCTHFIDRGLTAFAGGGGGGSILSITAHRSQMHPQCNYAIAAEVGY